MITSLDLDTGEFFGYAFHPNGDKVKIIDCGITEPDTGAFVSNKGYPIFEYDSTGEILKIDELNAEIDIKGSKTYLHEFLLENVKWE